MQKDINAWKIAIDSSPLLPNKLLERLDTPLRRAQKGFAIFTGGIVNLSNFDRYEEFYYNAKTYRDLALQELTMAQIFLDQSAYQEARERLEQVSWNFRKSRLYNTAASETWNGNLEKALEIEVEAAKTVNGIAGLFGKTVSKITEKTGNPAIAATGKGLEWLTTTLNFAIDMSIKDVSVATKNIIKDKLVDVFADAATEEFLGVPADAGIGNYTMSTLRLGAGITRFQNEIRTPVDASRDTLAFIKSEMVNNPRISKNVAINAMEQLKKIPITIIRVSENNNLPPTLTYQSNLPDKQKLSATQPLNQAKESPAEQSPLLPMRKSLSPSKENQLPVVIIPPTLDVPQPPPRNDLFGLNMSSSITITKGNTALQEISVTMPDWNTDTLNFTVNDTLPVTHDGYIRNVSYEFIPKSCKITCTTKLKIFADSSDIPTGLFQVNIGTWGGPNITKSFELKIVERVPPDAPIVQAAPISASQIKLNWSDNAAQDDMVGIERKAGTGDGYALVHHEQKRILSSYVDSGLSPNTEYCYQVYFYNPYVPRSSASREQCATTLQDAPPIPQGKPDLVITSLRAPVTGNTGENAKLPNTSITIANNGPVSAGSFRLEFYWSPDPIITVYDIPATSYFIFGGRGLGPGESKSNSEFANGPIILSIPFSFSSGTYYLGAIIDDQMEVEESNETNNTRVADTGVIMLQGPPPPPTFLSPSDGFSYTYTLYDYKEPDRGKQVFEWNKGDQNNTVRAELFNGARCEGQTMGEVITDVPWNSGYIMKDQLPAGKTYSWHVIARSNGVPSIPSECQSFSIMP
ncbi:hypothetical protein HY250_04065 [Candidatus Azambacteria bacterium]|nr:hypothetical protein [Candidatus Azambacteria bacterium]